MGALLMFVGLIWAAIGVGNLIGMPWTTPNQETLFGMGPMFSVLLFVLSGLVITGIGKGISAKRAREQPSTEAASSQDNKKCPFCSELIEDDAIVCRHCDYDQLRTEPLLSQERFEGWLRLQSPPIVNPRPGQRSELRKA
jgi:ribosomal protein L40E